MNKLKNNEALLVTNYSGEYNELHIFDLPLSEENAVLVKQYISNGSNVSRLNMNNEERAIDKKENKVNKLKWVAIVFIVSALAGFIPMMFVDANSSWLVKCFLWFFFNIGIATRIVIYEQHVLKKKLRLIKQLTLFKLDPEMAIKHWTELTKHFPNEAGKK